VTTRNNHAKILRPYITPKERAVAQIDINYILSEKFVVVVPLKKKIGPKADFLNPSVYSLRLLQVVQGYHLRLFRLLG
jgi:hypothetical protein